MSIKFSFGNFSEQVLCDMVEMEAFHVLLGRPWMFHKKAFQNGKENTYEFAHDGHCYKLV